MRHAAQQIPSGPSAIATGPASAASAGDLPEDALGIIAKIAHKEAGIVISREKAPMVFSRLTKRLRVLNLSGIDAYCDLLQGVDGAAERQELISILTTNVTSFFREAHHFDFIRDTLAPRWSERLRTGARIRVWSAGCSSGQEPYSLAMTLLDAIPDLKHHDLKILATDIDPKILGKAARGDYDVSLLSPLPEAFRERFFVTTPDHTTARVSTELRDLIAFRKLNLLGDWPMTGKFDAIICRNVVIYFDAATQSRLWGRFRSILSPGGHLFLGHSERIDPDHEGDFESLGMTTYQSHSSAALS